MTSADPSGLVERTSALLQQAAAAYAGTPHAEPLHDLNRRLAEPLRVAVAGKVKSGKSTLLNALVGERLAPTDAGECTRIVTWYRDGHTYEVLVQPHTGPARQARFNRDGGALEVDLGGLTPDDVAELRVTWPSRALRATTLVDTPGIGSLSESVARRTWALLTSDEDDATPADAVLYLMKHLHSADLEFLQAFHDAEVSRPNPVNAVGILSRADEIGVGRIDAMASARRIARRLSTDPRVRRVVQTVVPVAGLLAETAVTLTEAEVQHLRVIADRPAKEVESLLLSVDRFLSSVPELGLTSTERQALLDRFGVFGVRLTTTLLRRRPTLPATELSAELVSRSGLDDLQSVLRTLFQDRGDLLKSRSALLALDALLRAHPVTGSAPIGMELERLVASAHPFNELRVLSAVRAGWVTGRAEVIADLERVVGASGTGPAQRLGLPADAGPEELRARALDSLVQWQRRAENPLTPHDLAVASRVAVRTCEGMLASWS